MPDLNQLHNRAVWFDIPGSNLERASRSYAAVLAIQFETMEFDGQALAVLEHGEGRIRDATAKGKDSGGEVLEDVHPIGPHGFKSVILDSEGNRLALHSIANA